MSGDPPDRTVFQPPRPGAGQPQAPDPAPEPDAAIEPPPRPADDGGLQGAPAVEPSEQAGHRPAAAPPPTPPGRSSVVTPGVVLNNIYEVKRYLARGGMAEVYEGFNVNTDERVAIKIILPALASDPNVQAMFQKEARSLSRLHHPAVVQYRLLGKEPVLDLFYIVTEFIDGAPLSEVLGDLRPSPEQIRKFARRLAEGLGAAHALNAVHRDMSPDNVLLPDRQLDQAKIIDFGIAKDMDATKGTIVGDGFAGKLGYVAPEQFGEYDRAVGPWTDVYSLGLVVLAVVRGRNVDMGATLVEAVDRRRAGPDLEGVEPNLRGALSRMLVADPAKRLRSMEEVVQALDAIAPIPTPASSAPPRPAAPPPEARPSPPRPAPDATPPWRRPVVLAGAAAGGLIILVGAILALRGGGKPSAPPAPPRAAVTSVAVRQSIEAALPTLPCSWLDLTEVTPSGPGFAVKLQGVAGRPTDAQSGVINAVGRTGAQVADLNLNEVAPVGEPLCGVLDGLRTVRAPGRSRISTPQRKFEIVQQSNGAKAARAVVELAIHDPASDFALVGVEPTGKTEFVFPSRAEFNRVRASLGPDNAAIADLGGDAWRIQIDTDHKGWSGMLLLTGKGPFDPRLLVGQNSSRSADWPARFQAAAAKGGWKTEMVWYRTVDPGEP